MRNHLLPAKHGYVRLLFETEKQKYPLTWARLQTSQVPGLNVDVTWLSRAIWTFMMRQVAVNFQRSCSKLIGGEETDGLELR